MPGTSFLVQGVKHMAAIKKEVETRLGRNLFPVEFEERTIDKAIAWLDDMPEMDEASMTVRWQKMPQAAHQVPMLYIYFANIILTPSMPRVHVTELGETRPAHAICLVSLPSCHLLDDEKLKKMVRLSVEDFFKKHNVKRTPMRELGVTDLPLSPVHQVLSKANGH